MPGDVRVGENPAAPGVDKQTGAEPRAVLVLDERLADGRPDQHGPLRRFPKGFLTILSAGRGCEHQREDE